MYLTPFIDHENGAGPAIESLAEETCPRISCGHAYLETQCPFQVRDKKTKQLSLLGTELVVHWGPAHNQDGRNAGLP